MKLVEFCRDEINGDTNEINDAGNYRMTTTIKPFEYKTKIIGSTHNNSSRLDAEVAVPLKYLSNFWKSLDLTLINCELELDLPWSKDCVIFEKSRIAAVAGNPGDNLPVLAAETTLRNEATFQINNAKLYVPIVTLSINDNIKFLENVKQGFERTISWNKYRSKKLTKLKYNNLH